MLKQILLIIALASFFSTASLADGHRAHPALSSQFDSLLVSAIESHGYPGVSAAVTYQGKIYYQGQAGFSSISSERAPDRETVFRMYSLSKGITEIASATLIDAQSLDLDKPISNYVDALPESIKPITTRELLHHRSGIRHYAGAQEWMMLSQDHCRSPEQALYRFINDPLIFETGADNQYSSFGFVLLSEVLEKASGNSIQTLMEEHVFQPSGAVRIEFDNPQARQFDNVSTYYELAGDTYIVAPAVDNSCKFGGGAINATPTAVAKIFSSYYAVKLASIEAMNGLTAGLMEPGKRISLSGEGMGGRASLVAYPEQGLVVVIVANSRGGELTSYADRIAELIRTTKTDSEGEELGPVD